MKLLLIINPTASAVVARRRCQVEDILAADHDLTVAVTTGRDHATELARQAAEDGVDAVAVLGGDGALNEAANGLVGSSTALAPVPAGSTNVFARTIGFTDDPVQAARELVVALDRGSRRRVEMGTVNGRYFLFHLGVGFDAEVVERVEAMGSLKRHVGQPAFVYAAIATSFRQEDRTKPKFSVQMSNEGAVYQASFVICLNTNPYTFLGRRPLNVAPAAGLGRPLAVAVLHDLRLNTIGSALRSVLGAGTDLGSRSGVTVCSEVEALTVTAAHPIAHQVDGEYLGRAATLRVGYERKCLDIIVP